MIPKAASPGRGESLGKSEAQAFDENDSVPVVTSWDKRASFHEPGPINGLGVIVQYAGSETGHSSAILDGGDAQRLLLKDQPRVGAPSQRVDESTLLNVGASFDQAGTQQTFVGPNGSHVSHEEPPLNQLIRRSVKHAASARHDRRFLPLNKLDELITLEAVYKELQHHQDFHQRTSVELDSLAHAICDNTSPTISHRRAGDLTTTYRKRIFATLILMERVDAIELFIQNDLFDVHLPFQLPTDHYGNGPLYWTSTRDGEKPINPIALFSGWRYHERELFEKYQWQFLSPFFSLSPGHRPRHYVLQDGIILPFVEDLEGKGHEPIISGGFSEVWRVRIHDAHYSHPSSTNPNFAVKRLRQCDRTEQMFKREVATLKRLSSKQDHPHLMRLELTYLWKDYYHLLFRWADGNLKTYWETYREPHEIPRTQPYAVWVAKQLLGLTEGLQAIHLCPPDDECDEEETGDGFAAQRDRGRHGDVKPENILWFRDGDADQHGRLVISDFGLTNFHRKDTGRVDPASIARSPTYRPPEFDIRDQITQSFDIWTWGCVLLEFSVWYLKGYQAWDDFSMERCKEDRGDGPPHWQEDTYFHREPRETFVIAKMKPSVVKQFRMLRDDRNIPQFLVDLLNLVEGKLLRMCPEHRSTCDDIVKDLKTIYDKCVESHEYCVSPVPGSPPVRVDTDLSELTPRISKFDGRRPSASSPDRRTVVRFLTPDTSGQSLPDFESSTEAESDGATTYAENTDDEGQVAPGGDDRGGPGELSAHTSAQDQTDPIQSPAPSKKPASETTTTDLAPSHPVPEMKNAESKEAPKKIRRWRQRLFSCFLA